MGDRIAQCARVKDTCAQLLSKNFVLILFLSICNGMMMINNDDDEEEDDDRDEDEDDDYDDDDDED